MSESVTPLKHKWLRMKRENWGRKDRKVSLCLRITEHILGKTETVTVKIMANIPL